ncbi:succinate dehydrogenase assembly factor 2, mitochondrial isoform X2 [Arachis ipaensis]|uniref:succinate dehydrogenase assembly factor 2, mitochondrial isoform X2 n=2 Tax=Arachis ipaensis TaxID=130454 RepID=UPI000A2B46B1|nr:succinate dehydrogenase assembly factor 2, mitochondrial isoform X2 [Arachis ipaensis]XP_020977419.1 succinate dehydrogenase assembly factor 2, mitochondrial isoform X2 [Arachis ipaensis]
MGSTVAEEEGKVQTVTNTTKTQFISSNSPNQMGSLRRGLINLRRFLTSSNPTASPLPRYSLSSPFSSLPADPFSLHIDLSDEESKRRLFNRLIYRSKQRGLLELDLVLGKWVEDNIHSLDESRVRALVHMNSFLHSENPDLWKWLSGQEKPPESVSSNPVFAAVHERVMKNLESHSAPETRATPGQPWVRGWDDIKKGRDGPIVGNQ